VKKIPTIFKRDPNDMSKVTDDPHPDCSWVFNGEGKATRKYDGTCCMVDSNGKFWKRREIKKGKKLPNGFQLEQEDPITGKCVGWVKVDINDPTNQYHGEAWTQKNHHDHGTYELCGPKVQSNPERLNVHTLIKHSDAEVFDLPNRTYDGIKKFLSNRDTEGIVFHHPDGRMAKIKKRDFGLKRK